MNRISKQFLSLSAAMIGIAAGANGAQAAVCSGVLFSADFSSSYSCNSLGTPTGVTAPLGGITFLDNDTLLIGGSANNGGGYIASIDVTRDGDGHITAFSTPSSLFATAPNIDGGLAFGPGGVLFATGYPNNTLLQFKPGSTAPDKITTLNSNLSSLGTLAFVPDGFAGAGSLKIASYNNGNWADGFLTPDGTGTYDVTTSAPIVTLGGGPEGIVYVKGANAGFGVDSVLISEYGLGSVGVYSIDANGNPILSTRKTFLSGLNGAEGAVIDPLTGDFLFSTFGSTNAVFVISGFIAPPPPPPPPPPPSAVPEPASWALMIAGFGLVGHGLRRSRRSLRVRFG